MIKQTLISLAILCCVALPAWSQITVVNDIPASTILENRADDATSGFTRVADPGAGVTWYTKVQTFSLFQTEEIHNVYLRTDDATANLDDIGDLTLEFQTHTADVPDNAPGVNPLHIQTETYPAGVGTGEYLRYQLDSPLTLNAGDYALMLSTNDLNLYFDINTGDAYPDGTISRWNGTEYQVRSNDFVFGFTGPQADPLKLLVDRGTGAVTMENANGTGLSYDLDYYEISSQAGSLNVAGWNSLEDQNLAGFPAGNGTGNGWEEGGNNTSNLLVESYLLGSSTLTDGQSVSLGNAFNGGATEDLEFLYHEPGTPSPTVGLVEYVGEAGIDGDFNNDGAYDCADIDALTTAIAGGSNNGAFDLTGDGNVNLDDRDAWLVEAGAANLANGNPFLLGDGNLDGVVDVSDFGIWNANKFTNNSNWCSGDWNADGVVDVSDFGIWNGNKFSASDAAAVPEPATMATLLLGLLFIVGIRRR